MPRWLLFVPFLLFFALAAFLLRGLSLDPKALPSALIDRPLPAFDLPRLGSDDTVTSADVVGEVSLLNVWATWCISCRVEHPYLQKLAREEGVPIYGINYKDSDAEALRWLTETGDPYRFSIADRAGTLGVDLGVYGAPETYLLDAQGVIRYRHVGVIDDRVWRTVLKPLYLEVQGLSGGAQ